MKLRVFLCILSVPMMSSAFADAYLTAQDQKYFKNDIMDGNNTVERITMNVREINKIHAQLIEMKAQIALLTTQVAELQKKK
jgi:hypothetical protein